MSKIFFTITGTCYRYGQDFIEQGMVVRLVKEPDKLCMFCLRECWGMLRWRRSAARLY